MDKIGFCLKHDRMFEIHCKKCAVHMCLECLSSHTGACTPSDYIHISQYAELIVLPKIDTLIKENAAMSALAEDESTKLLIDLCNIVTPLKAAVTNHADNVAEVRTAVSKLETYARPAKQVPYLERRKKGLENDKKKLQEAIKNDNLQAIVNITKQIVSEAESSPTAEATEKKEFISKLITDFANLPYLKVYEELIGYLQDLLLQSQRLRLSYSVNNWRVDSKYRGTQYTISPNGLELSIGSANGHPGIIGDTPIDYGILVYEVTATGLCCAGKEGFGAIELEKYKALYAANKATPTIHDSMMGIFHGEVAKNVTVISGKEIILGLKYVVCIDMCNLVLTIKGPCALCTADLKPDVAYVPCFSMGCTANKMLINPLDMMMEEEC